MEICGPDAPMGTFEPVPLRGPVHTPTVSIRTSNGHPTRALRASQHGHYGRFLNQAIYILPSAMHHELATLSVEWSETAERGAWRPLVGMAFPARDSRENRQNIVFV